MLIDKCQYLGNNEIFFWGVEMCVINSYIVYRAIEEQNNKVPMKHYKYVKNLVDQLRGDFRETWIHQATYATDIRLNNQLHLIFLGKKKKDCIVCSDRKTPGERRQTSYYCDTCPTSLRYTSVIVSKFTIQKKL